MNKIRTVIVEDEAPARDILKYYLKDFPEIEIKAECADGFSGLKTISEIKPDLVFLDIQMPRLTGFELLEVMTEKPVIIFTTAYDQFAIKAFELNAIDYLLKPFPKERLHQAVKRAMEKIGRAKDDNKTPTDIIDKMPGHASPLSRIVVRKGSAINLIPTDHVRYIEAQDDYVMIYHSNGKAMKQQSMKFFDENLPRKEFLRIHRSYIVKIAEVNRIEPYGKDNHIAILKTGDRLPVSRAGYKHLKDELNF
jgi:two-component system LytT family response regulator